MRTIALLLIKLYQQYISPLKGFHCAHHALYRSDTCSNAVKRLIQKHGVVLAWPLIKQRFKDCRNANERIKAQTIYPNTDLPCALPCDIAIGDCGLSAGTEAACSCGELLPWDIRLSRRAKQILLASLVTIALLASYWLYGRDVATVYVTDRGVAGQSLFGRLVERGQPEIRVLLVVNGHKYYSNIVAVDGSAEVYTLSFEKAPKTFEIDELKILDARVKTPSNLLVLGQVLEQFPNPEKTGEGGRFSYRLKRRWHLF